MNPLVPTQPACPSQVSEMKGEFRVKEEKER